MRQRELSSWEDELVVSTAATSSAYNTPNLPTNIVPTNIAWLKLSGKFPMGLEIPPL